MPDNVFAKKGARVRLDDISAEPPDGMTQAKAEKRLEKLGEELFDLQDAMWGAKLHALLVVLQGRDAAGQDGTLKHPSGRPNPRGVQGVSFGGPTRGVGPHRVLF